jgi:hypothetical protein
MPTLFSNTSSNKKLYFKPIHITCDLDLHFSDFIGLIQRLDYLNPRITVKKIVSIALAF